MISVALASFNGEAYIEEQLRSILSQLSSEDEVIVSDDGSTDRTRELVEDLNDRRIRLIDGPKEGIIANFEHAIRECRGDYIFLSDQDDVWLENKVHDVMRAFELSGAALVMHDARVVGEDLKTPIFPSFFRYRGCKAGFFANILKNRYIGCCMAFRQELKKDFLPIPREIQMHDQWIGLQCDRYHRGTFLLEEPLLLYRRHDDANSDFSRNSFPIMLKNRLVLLRALLKFSRQDDL